MDYILEPFRDRRAWYELFTIISGLFCYYFVTSVMVMTRDNEFWNDQYVKNITSVSIFICGVMSIMIGMSQYLNQ